MTPRHREPYEIRAQAPDRIRFSGLPHGLQTIARRVGIRVDPAAGTLAWTSDKPRRGITVMRLPDRASPDDLPELHTACVASLPEYRYLIFADRSGRTIARSMSYFTRVFDVMWPPGAFDQLASDGVLVTTEQFRDARSLDERFPGTGAQGRVVGRRYGPALAGAVPMVIFIALLCLFAFGVL